MKFELDHKITYFEIDPDFKAPLGVLVKLLQEAAVGHSETVGFGSRSLVESGQAWVLNKMAIDITRYPIYQEQLRVVTWHKGSRGFKSFRDYAVYCGDEKIAAVSCMWLFVDLARKRLIRIPAHADDAYTVEVEDVLSFDVDAWKPDYAFDPDFTVDITTRSTDLDPLGHVNNVIYFDYVETALSAYLQRPPRISKIRIQFNREINGSNRPITAGLKAGDEGVLFKIFDSDVAFAAGILAPA